MAPFTRSGLVCFYCGRPSTRKYTKGLQLWQCGTCEAVNHLDENGDITDPPAFDELPRVQYAQVIERPVPLVFTAPDETLFCSTCIKNQHFLTQSLASYLPPPSDPRYDDYEREYPRYRKGLEVRYPQVCEACEPRVRERIEATGYAARTDHLRRMMDRSRHTRSSYHEWRWRHIVVYAGAIGWWVALVGQLLWNALGAVVKLDRSLGHDGGSASLTECLWQSRATSWDGLEYVDSAQPMAKFTLGLGLLTVWWNPCLAPKLHGSPGRMVGLKEFYKLQGILCISRCLAGYVLRLGSKSHLEASTFNAIHATMFAFNLGVSVKSYFTARIDLTPKVIFQDSPGPLLAKKTGSTQPIATPTRRTAPHLSERTNKFYSRESIQPLAEGSIAAPKYRNDLIPYQPPTPPPDQEVDEMDWTPAKEQFRPTQSTHIHQPTPIRAGPSPFHGQLPPLPISQAHQLWNLPNQPLIPKPLNTQQRSFFRDLGGSKTPRTAGGNGNTGPGAGDEGGTYGDALETSPVARRLELTKPNFFPSSDFGSDTGLESLFTGFFSLQDEPAEVRAASEQMSQRTISHNQQAAGDIHHIKKRAMWDRVSGIALLGISIWSWSYAQGDFRRVQDFRFAALGVAAVITIRGLAEALHINVAYWKLSDMLLLGVELALATFLGTAVNSSRVRGIASEEDLASGPLWFFGFLLMQELFTLWREFKASPLAAPPLSSVPDGSRISDTLTSSTSGLPSKQSPALVQSSDGLGADKLPRNRPEDSQAKIESHKPPLGLSSLSLGFERGNTAPLNPSFSTWAGQRNAMARNTRSRGPVPPWARGTL